MDPSNKRDEDWQTELTPEQYRVLREKGTEPAFSGDLLGNKEMGMYTCAACNSEIFSAETKFESGSGWPSFWEAVDTEKIELHEDTTHGMQRTEVICANCGGHLGHLFDDAPQTPTGQRYCINSVALKFKKDNS